MLSKAKGAAVPVPDHAGARLSPAEKSRLIDGLIATAGRR